MVTSTPEHVMTDWTRERVAARLAEASETGRRLSPVRVQGYFNTWPKFVRNEWEAFSTDDRPYRPYPPSPDAIDRMLESMRWMQWLKEQQRHLLWMRARNEGWKAICKRFGCDRTTAWRHWHKALDELVIRLNATANVPDSGLLSNVG